MGLLNSSWNCVVLRKNRTFITGQVFKLKCISHLLCGIEKQPLEGELRCSGSLIVELSGFKCFAVRSVEHMIINTRMRGCLCDCPWNFVRASQRLWLCSSLLSLCLSVASVKSFILFGPSLNTRTKKKKKAYPKLHVCPLGFLAFWTDVGAGKRTRLYW